MKVLFVFLITLMFLSCGGETDNGLSIYSNDSLSDQNIDSNKENVDDVFNDSLENDSANWEEKLNKVLEAQGHLMAVDKIFEETLKDSIKDEDFMVYTYTVKHGQNFPTLESFGQNTDILYLGSVIDGYMLASENNYSPLTMDVNPITISLSLESSVNTSGALGAGSLSTIIEKPTLSSVREGIYKLVNNNAGTELPVNVEYSYETIYSQEQMNISLGIPLASIDISKTLGLDWGKDNRRIKKILKFKQKAFSVDMDTPKQFISNSNDIDALVEEFGKVAVPTYVSTVNYGSVVYVAIESDLSETDLDVALKIGSTSGGAGITEENSSIKVFQYGGNEDYQDAIINSIYENNGVIDIKSMLENQDLQASKAVPISYKLRYVDDNTIAKVGMYDEYEKKIWLERDTKVSVTLKRFDLDASDGVGGCDFSTSYSVYAVSGGISKLIDTWSDSDASASLSYFQEPNKKDTFTFDDFDPKNDYIKVVTSLVEYDAFDDDHGSATKEFYIDDWGDDLSVKVISSKAGYEYSLSIQRE